MGGGIGMEAVNRGAVLGGPLYLHVYIMVLNHVLLPRS